MAIQTTLPHKSTHATGGSDPITPASIGAAATGHTHVIADVTGLQTALDGKQAAGDYVTLVNGLVPSAQLPSYVDDVIEYAALANFPATGEAGKIYVVTSTGKIYRWSGSAYVEISPSPGSTDSVTEGVTNLYFTAARAVSALASTLSAYATQAWVTAQSYATTSALNSAISALVTGVSSVAGRTGAVTLAKGDVGLGNVDNTSDAAKPVSTATQAALNTKANAAPVYQIYDHIVAGTTNLLNQSAIASGGGSMSSSTRLNNSIGVATLTTSSTLTAAYSVVGINPAAGAGNNTAKAVDLALGDRNIHSTRSAFFALPSATITGLWFSGFLDNFAATPTNGCYFRVVNGGNLQCVCANNGVETVSDYGSVPTAGMHLYEVVVKNFGTAVDFFYDGSLIATLTTNIPTGTTRRVNYGVGVAKTSTAVAGSIEIDLDLVFLRLGSYSGITLNT